MGSGNTNCLSSSRGSVNNSQTISPPTPSGFSLTRALIAAGEGERERERGALPAHHPPRHLPLPTSCLFNNLPEPGTFPGPGNTSSLRGGKARAFPSPTSAPPHLCHAKSVVLTQSSSAFHLSASFQHFPLWWFWAEHQCHVPPLFLAVLVHPPQKSLEVFRAGLGFVGGWNSPRAGGWNSIFRVHTIPNHLDLMIPALFPLPGTSLPASLHRQGGEGNRRGIKPLQEASVI